MNFEVVVRHPSRRLRRLRGQRLYAQRWSVRGRNLRIRLARELTEMLP